MLQYTMKEVNKLLDIDFCSEAEVLRLMFGGYCSEI
jgi:hypothetical protein